jgi:hypothetical protein
MVISDRPVSEVVPVEWARMADRTVLQWDKDDCATVGLVKFDLLGLGMLSALHYMIDLVAEHHCVTVDIGRLDLADPAVYDMLCRADAVGVFQVESRAQLATLPRLRPRKFYDLVVEVALIRPGPIQGGSVHPYIRRRRGEEQWEHAHPLLASSLDRTLGVPFQAAAGQARQPRLPPLVERMDAFFGDDGRAALAFATQVNERNRVVFERVCAAAGVPAGSVERVIYLHDSRNAFGELAKELGVGLDRTNCELAMKYGHLGPADQLLSLERLLGSGELVPGDPAAVLTMGSGMQWACTLLAI